MKKAHEVTVTRWSTVAPFTICRWIKAQMDELGSLETEQFFKKDRKLRITIRVEVVDE